MPVRWLTPFQSGIGKRPQQPVSGFVTGASSKTWIPELIAAADSKVTETYIDFFTSTIRNRNTRAAYARGLAGSF
jgi:hypothetical protein